MLHNFHSFSLILQNFHEILSACGDQPQRWQMREAFLLACQSALLSAAVPRTVSSGLKKSGVFPCNPALPLNCDVLVGCQADAEPFKRRRSGVNVQGGLMTGDEVYQQLLANAAARAQRLRGRSHGRGRVIHARGSGNCRGRGIRGHGHDEAIDVNAHSISESDLPPDALISGDESSVCLIYLIPSQALLRETNHQRAEIHQPVLQLEA